MKVLRKIEIEEIKGTWIINIGDETNSYSQHPSLKDHVRLVKDLLKHLELSNLVEVKER